jgi:type IV pilus assembly protein PilO
VTLNLSTPTRKIAAGAAGAAVLLLLVWYGALWRPETQHLNSAHHARAAAEQQVAQLDQKVLGLKVLKRQIPADTAKLAQFEAAVPNNPDLRQALDQLQQAATNSGVLLGSVGPEAPVATTSGSSTAQSSGPPSISLSMTATGTYAQTMAFVTALDNMPRTVVVDQLAITGGNTETVTASLSARIFYSGSANS